MPKPKRSVPTRGRRRVSWRTASLGLAVLLALSGLAASGVLGPQHAEASSLLSSTRPKVEAFDDSVSVTVGVAFTVRRPGTIVAVRFYKGKGNTGTHQGGVFDASGELVARATFRSETATGWQYAALDRPVAAKAGTRFTAAVLMPRGRYSVDENFSWPTDNPDLGAGGGTYRYARALELPDQSYAGNNYWVDVNFRPAVPASAPAGPTASTTVPSARPEAAVPPGSCVGEPGRPGGKDPWGGCWPGPQNTGYPHGLAGDTRRPVTLTAYTGPQQIRSCGVVIDSKIVTGDLLIQAGNGAKTKDKPCVVIRNSLVRGVIYSEEGGYGPTVVSDTEVAPKGLSWWENVGRTNIFVTRVNSHGSQGVIKCEQNCEAVDSWVHGMQLGGAYHYNAFGSNGMASGRFVIRHNWASCGDWSSGDGRTAQDAGCSAAIGFYGDFDPNRNISIERNYLVSSFSKGNKISTDRNRQSGYCLNPGYYPGKPFPRATDVKVVDNVFGRGDSGRCGVFGPTNSLNKKGDTTTGNTWSGNRYEDGTPIARPEE
ncbi:protein of unknown function [Microlunatus sagamiharensis]|uniref:DUF4082 domain-containing protein n=1 Tax=Microlunatus sagamiharensis TaxID=546874 RepID=A0A1H2LU63_9ACTN|nr:DUF4082 domain-containing protein [Microlunatus sagamiharensis]SDU84265.1 protein of unknown function [Microlunatus sagamiharensis]